MGHLSIAYIAAKATSKTLNTNINIPLVFLLSLIPDIDLIIPGLNHRGITHSIIILTLLFLPAFAIYKKKAIPYFAALIQHVIIGDLTTGTGIQLFWPITQTWYGLVIPITSMNNILFEWTSFIVAVAIMFITKDTQKLLKNQKTNLLLAIPLATVLLPSIIQFPLTVPISLLAPHLFYITLLTIILLYTFYDGLKKMAITKRQAPQPHQPTT